jgi:tetratricopeptide (TPR) repeat protein
MLPEDVTIVSGHNDIGTWHDLHAYRDMLVRTTEIIREALSEGKEVAAIQNDNLLGGWERYAGSYVSLDEWVEYLAAGFQEEPPSETKDIFVTLYDEWKQHGASAAVELYRELKRNHVEEYRFSEFILSTIGATLLNNNDLHSALWFLDASIEDYPDSRYSYYTYYQLAKTHKALGDRELAAQYCEKALELNPDYGPASVLLQELKQP